MNSRICIPSANTEQWKQFLADPEKQWRQGFSARSLPTAGNKLMAFRTKFRRYCQFLPLSQMLSYSLQSRSIRFPFQAARARLRTIFGLLLAVAANSSP